MTGPLDIIVTGTPRSGTTLICSLLNKLDNIVAVHEPPLTAGIQPGSTDGEAVAAIAVTFDQERTRIRTTHHARSQSVHGVITDNPIGDHQNAKGLRKRQSRANLIRIEKPLTPDFPLIFKHPGVFTILLPELVHAFPCYAIIRNPLATLASWSSVDLPIQRGHMPMLDRLRPEFATRLAALPTPLERQLVLLNWFYEQYHQHLPPEAVIPYERIIESRGRALAAIHPTAGTLDEPLTSRNLSSAYGRDKMLRLGEALLMEDGVYWKYYSRASIELLLAETEVLAPSEPDRHASVQ